MLLDSGWMDEVTGLSLQGELDKKEYEQRIGSIRRFERQLTDNGVSVDEIFAAISVRRSRKKESTRWREY